MLKDNEEQVSIFKIRSSATESRFFSVPLWLNRSLTGAIKSASHPPWKGAESLAGGEQSEPPEYCNKPMRPGRGAGSSCNPCRGAYRCFSATQGLASLTPG